MTINVEIYGEKWPPISYLESDIISNIALGFFISTWPNPIIKTETNTLCIIIYAIWAKTFKFQNKNNMTTRLPF